MSGKVVKTMRSQVYQLIKDDILEGVYPSGHWLQEAELSKTYAVSRSPVREALHQLSAEGLVTEIPNKGVFVREYTAADIYEIFDVRVLLENHAIDLLSEVLDEQGKRKLEQLLEELQETWDRQALGPYINMDSRLHETIVRLSGSGLLKKIYDQILGQSYLFRAFSASKCRYAVSMDEHQLLIRSLLGGDFEKAKAVNREHLRKTAEDVVSNMERGKAAQTLS